MKRTPLLLTIAVIAGIVGGYLLYERVFNRDPLTLWSLVPERTLFVYEKDVCETCREQVAGTALWEVIQKAAAYGRPADSLMASVAQLMGASKELLVSAHVIRKDDFDFVYYLTSPPPLELAALTGYRYTQREFNNTRIYEVASDKLTFSWAFFEDFLVGSFTPFLLEDVIRTYHGKVGFQAAHPQLRGLPRIAGDAGNVYLHLGALSEWLSVFAPRTEKPWVIGESTLLDIKMTEKAVVLNGFSTATSRSHLLSLFGQQSPVGLSVKNQVPTRTVMLTTFGISDGVAFSQALESFVVQHRPELRDSLNHMASGLSFDWQELYSLIGDEVALCEVESVTDQRLARVLMIESPSTEVWTERLDALSEKLSTDTVFYEHFSQYTIRELPVRDFPGKLLWPLVGGFGRTYYCASENVVYISDHLEELKRFLEDIEHEDTWGKSVSRNQFLEATLLESNLSVYVNVPRVWNLLLPKLNSRWRNFVTEHAALVRRLDMTAFQFSHLNNTFYTNITFQEGDGTPDVAFVSSAPRNVVHLPQALQRVHVVKSHVSPANEILVQDSLNDLRLIAMDGRILWTLPIGDQITSDIQQVDFYNNGKLQYIFTTRDALHIIDRLGNYVPSYPLHLKGRNIRHLTVVDYDRSKRYRFLITEVDGKIWMYDKSGNNLEGWTPVDAGGELFAPARHHRIRGRDFIIAIRKDGNVQLYNRRGEMMEGFPLDVQGRPMGDYFLDIGQDIADSWFVVITRDGYRVKFNAEGKILHRETLLRVYVGSQFSLVPERSNKSYLVVQHDRRQLTISDPEGKQILTNNYIDVTQGGVQYYHLSGGKQFICLTDRVQQMSYIFDGAGQLLTSPPLESTGVALNISNRDASHVSYIHGNRLTIQSLNP